MVNRSRLNWRKEKPEDKFRTKLYFGNKFTGTKVSSDIKHPEMFWIITKQGNSVDFYNRARAKQHAADLTSEDMHLEQCL